MNSKLARKENVNCENWYEDQKGRLVACKRLCHYHDPIFGNGRNNGFKRAGYSEQNN